MAKETKENKKAAENAAEPQDFKVNNHVDEESLVEAAVADMKKEEADKKKREIKDAIGLATYQNVKTRAELRARRREDDITKEKLDGTKKLLERVIGFETEIVNGRLVPTKNKCKEPVLTPTEYKEEKRKLNEEIEKKISESNKQLRKDLDELRASYEGRYAYWWD
jgi:hypothetical protein